MNGVGSVVGRKMRGERQGRTRMAGGGGGGEEGGAGAIGMIDG
jgi:hypothetical protein